MLRSRKIYLLKAIDKGFFKTWPGLTDKLVKIHLHPTTYTAKGHLSQTKQHLQSTKSPSKENNSTYLANIRKNIKVLKSTATSGEKQSLEELLRSILTKTPFHLLNHLT